MWLIVSIWPSLDTTLAMWVKSTQRTGIACWLTKLWMIKSVITSKHSTVSEIKGCLGSNGSISSPLFHCFMMQKIWLQWGEANNKQGRDALLLHLAGPDVQHIFSTIPDTGDQENNSTEGSWLTLTRALKIAKNCEKSLHNSLPCLWMERGRIQGL